MIRPGGLRIFLLAAVVIGAVAASRLLDDHPYAEALPGTDTPVPRLAGPDFAGKALHYQMHLLLPESTNSKDRFVADVWLYFNEQGDVAYEHAVTTHDGDFDQAVFYDFAARTTTFVSSKSIFADSPEPICRMEAELDPTSFAKYRASGLPVYSSPDFLRSTGFRPTAEALDSATLVASPDANTALEVLTSTHAEGFEVATQFGKNVLQIDPDSGRVVGWAVFTNGVKTYEELITAVEVFDGSKLAEPLLQPEQFEDACK